MEINDIAIRSDDLKKYLSGDKDAGERIRKEFDGIVLYEHILSLPEEERELYEVIDIDYAHKIGLIDFIQVISPKDPTIRNRFRESM